VGGWVHIGNNTHVCVVFTKVPWLTFTKLSAGYVLYNNELKL